MIGVYDAIARFAASVNIDPLPQVKADDDHLKAILSIVFAVMGSIAFIVIVVAGLRYTLSNGDPSAMAKAKNTIIYASIGLIVTILAFAIVRFALSSI